MMAGFYYGKFPGHVHYTIDVRNMMRDPAEGQAEGKGHRRFKKVKGDLAVQVVGAFEALINQAVYFRVIEDPLPSQANGTRRSTKIFCWR